MGGGGGKYMKEGRYRREGGYMSQMLDQGCVKLRIKVTIIATTVVIRQIKVFLVFQ